MWALVAPLAKRFLRQSHSTPFWNAFPSVYLFFSAKIHCRTHLLKKSVLHINTLAICFFECLLSRTYVLGETLPRFLGTCFFWGGHNMYHIGHSGPLTIRYPYPDVPRHESDVPMWPPAPSIREAQDLDPVGNQKSSDGACRCRHVMVDLNLTPLKINGWNMSSWRFGSDHSPFWVICMVPCLILQGVLPLTFLYDI